MSAAAATLPELSTAARESDSAGQLQRYLRRDYVLYVGSRAQYKNFRSLLRAFRDSPAFTRHSISLCLNKFKTEWDA